MVTKAKAQAQWPNGYFVCKYSYDRKKNLGRWKTVYSLPGIHSVMRSPPHTKYVVDTGWE